MAEATYTDSLYLVSRLGRGKQIVAINLTSTGATTEITTGFKRCVPVASPGAGGVTLASIAAVAGVVTLTATTGKLNNVIIVGDLY